MSVRAIAHHRSLRCVPSMQMAERPKQQCDLSREELKDDKLGLRELCPFCKDRQADVMVGDHKSRDALSGQHHSAQRAQPLS
jgi:hypothetical protein